MIGEVISSFEQPVTLSRRTGSGTTSKGRFTPASATTSTIKVGLVPASKDDLERLPEGMRSREIVRVFAQQELLVHPNPDEITWLDAVYEVQSAAYWNLGGFWDCLAVKKAVQA